MVLGQDGGDWSDQLRCEIPLLVIAGGLAKDAPEDAEHFEAGVNISQKLKSFLNS